MAVWHQLFPSIPLFMLLCAAVLLAGTIRSFTGFGGGLVLAPLFSLFMTPANMVVVVLLLNLLTSVQTLPSTWRTTDWRLVWSLSIPALLGVPLGVWLVEWMNPNMIRRVIGVIVAGVACIMLTGWKYDGARGPPLVLYLLSAKDISPVVLRSFFMMFFTIAQTSTLVFFLYQGMINKTQLIYSVSFAPVYLVSTVLGSFLFVKALKGSVDLIKRLSLWFLLVVGVVTLAI